MTSPVSAAVAAQRYNSSPAALAARMQMLYIYDATTGGGTLGNANSLVAQGASNTFNLILQADYDFMVYSMAVTIVDSTSAVVLPANSTALIQINDTGAGANWFSQAVGLSSFCGTAQLPAILPVVRVIAKTATLAITITNIKDGAASAGAGYNVAFIGAKLKNTNAPMTFNYPGAMG